MDSLNIIGDIAGNYFTLMALIKKMPTGVFISLGDMIDRGPRSKQVLEWFKSNGLAIYGNHEDLMMDFIKGTRIYHRTDWFRNGGQDTLKSFEEVTDENGDLFFDVPKDLVDWISELPLFMEFPGLYLSHAPRMRHMKDICAPDKINVFRENIVWNRYVPTERLEDKVMVYGHNADTEVRYLKDEKGVYAMGIDTSKAHILTGLHFPSMQIYQQEYID